MTPQELDALAQEAFALRQAGRVECQALFPQGLWLLCRVASLRLRQWRLQASEVFTPAQVIWLLRNAANAIEHAERLRGPLSLEDQHALRARLLQLGGADHV